MSALRLGDRDVRVAAALLLGCAAARAAVPGEPGLPCGVRELTGIPCPLCGMTTSVTATVELDLGAALAASPAGPLLVAVAVVVLTGAGRRLAVRPAVVYCALAAMWLWQLNRFAVV